ncbi:DoxX family protein [Cellulomonas sp. ICMP 17802]|uniref:DoxX family protein n=1 Tax=Cellulomonas sp. ICMP 17802 TaxID=3239199 RepID=UPI00351AFBDB
MNIALWIVAGLLAAAYLGAGIMKATQPLEKLKAVMPWTSEYSARTVRFVGVAEIAGAVGLILPWATGIAPVLTPIAATGLVVIQALAIRHHVQHREFQVLPVNVVLLLLALFVAIGRFAGL